MLGQVCHRLLHCKSHLNGIKKMKPQPDFHLSCPRQRNEGSMQFRHESKQQKRRVFFQTFFYISKKKHLKKDFLPKV